MILGCRESLRVAAALALVGCGGSDKVIVDASPPDPPAQLLMRIIRQSRL